MADNLSTEAIAVRIGVFLNAKTKLTMQNEVSILSPEAEKGLKELIAHGFVDVECNGIAATYTLTTSGADMDVKSLCGGKPFEWMDKYGRFPIAVKKGCD